MRWNVLEGFVTINTSVRQGMSSCSRRGSRSDSSCPVLPLGSCQPVRSIVICWRNRGKKVQRGRVAPNDRHQATATGQCHVDTTINPCFSIRALVATAVTLIISYVGTNDNYSQKYLVHQQRQYTSITLHSTESNSHTKPI